MSLAPINFMRRSPSKNNHFNPRNKLAQQNLDPTFKNNKISTKLFTEPDKILVLKGKPHRSIKQLNRKGSHSVPLLMSTCHTHHFPMAI
jgi:protein-tyrosine-phosphatase